nr:uncharacterized mitochondrial protein AtMg00810-like [Tanacetum cinerariifolium]
MFDEYLNPPSCADPQVPTVIAPESVVSIGTPSSTTTDQDAPSTKPSSEESSSQVVIPNNVHSSNQPPEHINKWTKDYPIDNVIGDPSRPNPVGLKPSKKNSMSLNFLSVGAGTSSGSCYDYYFKVDIQVSTPMVEKFKLDEDPQRKAVDPTCYHGMIGTLMYLSSSRTDLVFAVYMCSRYQAKPTEKHLHTVKRIFRYLRGIVNMGLWHLKDSCIALTAFADADYAGCQDTKKVRLEVCNYWVTD